MQSGTANLGRQVSSGVWALGLLLGLVGVLVGTVLAEELREPGFLGVQLREETERAEGGALVTQVVAGSPALQAGLQEGDIVIEFEGTAIRGPLALTQRIHTRQPGETVTLTVIRDGATETLEVKLGRRSDRSLYRLAVPPTLRVVPDNEIVVPVPALDPDEFPEIDPDDLRERFEIMNLDQYKSFVDPLFWQRKPRLGVQLVETTPELRKHLGGDEDAGVLVSKILSGLPAQRAGLQVGDLIVAVDGESVATSDDLIQALRDKLGQTFDVEIVRDHRTRTVEVTIPEPETDQPTGPRA